MRKIPPLTIFLVLFSVLSVSMNGQDARATLREVNRKFAAVQGYTADVLIRVDIPFVRMMPVKAQVAFSQPDKFDIKSKGIALLPRQGFDVLFKNLRDTAAYMPVYQGSEQVRGVPVSVISILPLSDTSDLVVGKLWVDGQRSLILRSQLTSRSNGTVVADYYFGKQAAYALPDSMLFTIDTRKFKIPKAVSADLNNVPSGTKKGNTDRQKGKIGIVFTDYIVRTERLRK